uniref:Uncharacterized protein n=1 Tax=Avena sativa TaxID=4498 RepID=A0ACD5ZEM9_AVESA
MDLRESRVTEMIQRDDRSKWLSYNNHNLKCFTVGEIERITSNYGAIIGKGGFGEVYKGFLEDGSTVAVKRFVRNVEEDFAKELKVHSEINHKNVVRLVGYCAEENALMIVTEYISKGNLSHVLHHDCIPIMLDTRLRIAVECSEALCYMHSQMYTQVIHGDIKPANILLDDNFHAKLSDFGISRLVNTEATLFTKHVIGSIGYMDPLFARYRRLTSKSDVYSFGIVLLELITKKEAIVRKGEIGIVECFTKALATGIKRVRELFDIEISSQNNMKVLDGVAKLAGECLKMEMDGRPEMKDVVERLRALRKTQVQGKQMLTIFPWGWRNKPAAENNGQSSSVSRVDHVSQSLISNLCRQFSLGEMKSMTSNFDKSHLVGEGRSSQFYYGVIDGGKTKVAIRCCKDVMDIKKFEEQIATAAKLRHHHLVSLVGFCGEYKNNMVLVYDYIANGTLGTRLFGYTNKKERLTWMQRLDICIGAARALHYLHGCSLIHLDFTTKDILLHERLVAKVTCEVLPVRSSKFFPRDTFGLILPSYIYPEFEIGIEPTEKSNVYSFGVVLFEVICGQSASDHTLPGNQAIKVDRALRFKDISDKIVDPYLEGKIVPRCFKKFVETAKKCVADHPVDRPSMREVLQNLEMCIAEQRKPW